MMPLFILYGGEIVIFLIVTRIAMWIFRSGSLRLPPDPGPGGPQGPRGKPLAEPSHPGPVGTVTALPRVTEPAVAPAATQRPAA